MSELIAGLLAIWLMGYGMTMIMRLHGPYLAFSRRCARGMLRFVRNLFRLVLRQIGHIIENAARTFPVGTAVTAIILAILIFFILSRAP